METPGQYLLFFGINLCVISLVVLLYYRSSRKHRPNHNRVVILVMAGALVHVVVDQMLRLEIGLCVGFGIVAIFSLLCFASVPISLREMTCLFTVVTRSMVNALPLNADDLTTLLAVDMALLVTLALLEHGRARSSRARTRRANRILTVDTLSGWTTTT